MAVALLTTVIGVALARGHAPPNNSKRRQAIARSVIHKLSGDYQLVATLPESNGRIGVVVRGIGRHVTGAGWITPPPRHLVINTLYGANGKVIDVHMPY